MIGRAIESGSRIGSATGSVSVSGNGIVTWTWSVTATGVLCGSASVMLIWMCSIRLFFLCRQSRVLLAFHHHSQRFCYATAKAPSLLV